MQIVASHRERRREDGSLSIDAVLILGEVEYVLERNCASRRHATNIAEEELRLIRRLILARLRQLHTDRRPTSTPLQPSGERSEQRDRPAVTSPLREQRDQRKPLVMPSLTGGPPIPLPGLERYRDGPQAPTLVSPVPRSTKSNGKLPYPRPDTISTRDL